MCACVRVRARACVCTQHAHTRHLTVVHTRHPHALLAQGFNQIGEWSLDKRHYGAAYPPRELQPPPEAASDGTKWLCAAWNEASANIGTWPRTRALGTVGWRRNKGDGIRDSSTAAKVLGTKWKWAGIPVLQSKRTPKTMMSLDES